MLDWTVNPLDGLPTLYLDVPAYQPLATAADGEAHGRALAGDGGRDAAPRGDPPRQRARGPRRLRARRWRASSRSWTACSPRPTRSGRSSSRWPASRRSTAGPRPTGTPRRHAPRGGRATTCARPSPSFRATLADEILPVARPPERAGSPTSPAARTPTGGLVRAHTSLDLDPAAVHEIGLAEIERIDAELTRWRAASSARGRWPDGLRACATTPPCVRHRATRSWRRPRPRWRAPTRPCRPGSAGSRAPRARSCGCRAHEEGTRPSPTTASPPRDGSRPGPVLDQHVGARDAAALRGGGPRLPRVRPRPPPPDRDRAGADGPARVPAPPRPDRLRRGLGPVHRAPGRRDGPLLGRPRPPRHALLRRLARLAPRRRHRASTPSAGPRDRADRGSCSTTRPSARTTSRTRSTATSSGRARRSPTSSASWSCSASATRPVRGSAPAFDIRAFHDAVLGHGALPLPTLGGRRRRLGGRCDAPG